MWEVEFGADYLCAAMAVMIYALVTYHWRAAAIARRGSGPYDDRLGPVSYVGFVYPMLC